MINDKMRGSTITIVYCMGYWSKKIAPKKKGLGWGGVYGITLLVKNQSHLLGSSLCHQIG